MALSEKVRSQRRAAKKQRRARRKARSSTDSLQKMYTRGERIVFAQHALTRLGEMAQGKHRRKRNPVRLRPGDRR